MTKAELMCYVGKKVHIYLKGEVRGIYGTLGYADVFSAKHDYRKPNYFYIGNTSFKVSHVRIIKESKGNYEFDPSKQRRNDRQGQGTGIS